MLEQSGQNLITHSIPTLIVTKLFNFSLPSFCDAHLILFLIDARIVSHQAEELMEEEEPYGDQDGLNGDQNMDGRAGQGDDEEGDGEGVSFKSFSSGLLRGGGTIREERGRSEARSKISGLRV